jgi:aspartokinase-like uncharacterized kinase
MGCSFLRSAHEFGRFSEAHSHWMAIGADHRGAALAAISSSTSN